MRLLITRPQPDAERTADTLRAGGHQPLLSPLLRFAPITGATVPDSAWAGLLFTSANAVRAVQQRGLATGLAGLPVLTVGGSTADAARAAGFADVTSADGDARDLAALAAARFAGAAPLLYLAAEHRSAEMSELLRGRVPVHTVAVYRMTAAREFSADAAAALAARTIDGVLHYSRRTAEAFIACADAGNLHANALGVEHYCLAAPIGSVLSRAGAQAIRVASAPDERALLDLIPAA